MGDSHLFPSGVLAAGIQRQVFLVLMLTVFFFFYLWYSFQPRSQPALRRRRQLFQRLCLLAGVSFLLTILIFPSWRAAVIPTLSLGLIHSSGDLQLQTVRYYDLSEVQGSEKGWERGERVLMLTPLRDASSHLPMFFSHLRNLTYPHNLIDLAFLVSDSRDDTLRMLSSMLQEIQNDADPKMSFGEISVIQKDFGQKVQQDVESRHGFEAQASRRKLMAQARNWLLSATLRPTHSWVYWRDADVETAPFTIIEDLMRHDKDVIVPSKISMWTWVYRLLLGTDRSSYRCLATTSGLARRRAAVRPEFMARV